MTWLARLWRRKRLDRELEAELRDHIERHAADLVASGVGSREARRMARAAFGGVETIKEQCRQSRGMRWLDGVGRDVRYARRLSTESPVFTAVAILSLALGIGANVAIFSLVDAVLLRTMPLVSPDRLILITENQESRQVLSFSLPQFEALRQSTTIAGLCGFRPWPRFVVTTSNGPQFARGQLTSSGCSGVIGGRAQLGRLLNESDEGARSGQASVVISHEFWRRHFGGDPSVIGRVLEIQRQPFTVIGVTPREFHGFERGQVADIMMPLTFQPVVIPSAPLLTSRTARWLWVIGRLQQDASFDQANADLQRRWQQHQRSESKSGTPPSRLELLPGAQGINDLRRQFSLPLRLLLGAVGLLLLVACANLASLLLARNQARAHEIALRQALGASRSRLVRQLVTEALVLSAIGAAGGLGLAFWGSNAIVRLLSAGRAPIALDVAADLRLIGFTAGLGVVTALLFGALPALRGSSVDLLPQLQTMARTTTIRRRREGVLVAAQTALSLVLIVGTGLFARSLARLHQADLGFRKDHVLLVNVQPGLAGYTGDRGVSLYQELYSRFTGLPGVRSVTLSMDTPLSGFSWISSVSLPGETRRTQDPPAHFNFVGPRFFETMGIPLLGGRDFRNEENTRSSPAAIVSESLARWYFPQGDAVGGRLQVSNELVEIIGIAKDVGFHRGTSPRPHLVYRPYLQEPKAWQALTLALRTDGSTAALPDLVRQELRQAAPTLPTGALTSLDSQFDASIATERLLFSISTFFGLVSLVLMAIGVYGTLAYRVARRTRELGVRLSLGANRASITRLLLKSALGPVLGGLLIGLPLALAGSRVFRGTLFEISATDPWTYAGCAVLLGAIAIVAAWLPSSRAARTDPLIALRQE